VRVRLSEELHNSKIRNLCVAINQVEADIFGLDGSRPGQLVAKSEVNPVVQALGYVNALQRLSVLLNKLLGRRSPRG